MAPDFKLTLWNDTKKTINELINVFPKEKENIHDYYNYYHNLASANQFDNVKLKDKTFGSFLRSYFLDNALMSAISYPLFGYVGLPPSLMHAFTGTKFFNETLIDGGYYLEGGMQTLPDAFAQVIEQNNGALLYKTLAKRILCSNDTAIGVELSNNKSYASKYVVAACDITQTFTTLLGRNSVDNQIMDKISHFTPSISSFILYIGTAKPFEELPAPGTNIWHLPHYDLDKMYKSVVQGDINNIGGGGFMFRVSPDKKTIFAICLTSFKTRLFWKHNKKKIAEAFLNNIAQVIPDLKKHIAYIDAATPYTLYRYTLNYQGANYGWAPLQSQLFDPDFRQKTFIKGLYITGHWTAQTHGIPGVAYLGHNTAKLILKRERINYSFS
jgi:phytoene dehydrogenase-like protein